MNLLVLSAAESDGWLRHTTQSQDDHGHQQTRHVGPSTAAAWQIGP